MSQAKENCEHFRNPFLFLKSSNKFIFGKDRQIAVGSINIRILVDDDKFGKENVGIVKLYIPFLIELIILTKY